MDLNYSPEEEKFREEVKQWLSINTKELPQWCTNSDVLGPEPGSKERYDFDIWWHKKLFEAGYVGITWPIEYGGRGGTFMQDVIFNEERIKHRAPSGANALAIMFCGPTLWTYGTEEQKQRFIRPMLTADEIWCEGFSEPGAGSDLASLQTKAVEDGDDYILNGQKVWTTYGHFADWAIILARTDPNEPRHRGISFFLMDMHLPGVTVRPLRQITGDSEFNELFLDNVRVPKNMMVGEKNKGWYVAMGTLDFERSGIGNVLAGFNLVIDLIDMSRKIQRDGRFITKDPLVRQQLSQFYIEASIAKFNEYRSLTNQIRGEKPTAKDSISFLMGAESAQRLVDFAVRIQGAYGELIKGSPYAIEFGRWQYNFLYWRCMTIASGTAEIKRNLLAQRVLGLPR